MADKIAKTLVEGNGNGSANNVYTCPAGRRAYITHIHFSNSSTTVASNVYAAIDPGGSSVFFIVGPKSLNASDVVDFRSSPGYVLSAGHIINIECLAGVSYFINGYEEILP